jgi:hypothetical protein
MQLSGTSAIIGNGVGSPVAATRTLIPADSGDVRINQGHCEISLTGFAIHNRRRSSDGRTTDREFVEPVRRIGMSAKGALRA